MFVVAVTGALFCIGRWIRPFVRTRFRTAVRQLYLKLINMPVRPDRVGSRSLFDQASDFVKEQPVVAAAIAAGIVAFSYVGFKIIFPDPVFAPSPSSKTTSALADPSQGVDISKAAEALIELGATGLLTAEEGAALTKEFFDLVKARSTQSADGVPRLDKAACRYVFERIGVKDTVVADRIFSTWDTDGTGSIDMKEFLHALVLVLRGSHHEKLEMAFTIMDMDNDGKISKPEMMRFLHTVAALNGEKYNILEVQKKVDAMFASIKPQMFGYLNRDEFLALASQTKFHLGEKLEMFLNNLQKKFSSAMAGAAKSRVPMLRTPSQDESGQFSDYNSLREAATKISTPIEGSPVPSPIMH